jgi:hypothetical protein
MADVTRRIGLSLGADICWPICYEQLLRRLDLALAIEGDTVRLACERLSIEPFGLAQPTKYAVVIDRLTHWYHVSREWIKKAILLDDLYVYNNPWSLQSMEKQSTYCAMMRLGLPVPETWLIPPKAYEPSADLEPTLRAYAHHFDIGEIGRRLGYPLFMKPYSGGGWVGVNKIDNEQQLRRAYENSGTLVMHLQQGIVPYDRFVRCIGLGPQLRVVNYDPAKPLHDRYRFDPDFLGAEDALLLQDMTLTINSFFGWDFNSCEALGKAGAWYPIDFANGCPDSQVTSLHYHFPWLIKANLRWSIFCATTGRSMRQTLDWEPYYAIAREDMPYREKLTAYAGIAHQRFDTERFREFCRMHLRHLDEVAYDFFGSDVAKDAVRQKVAYLYPAREVNQFAEMFWERIQHWREHEGSKADPDFA